MTHLQKKEIEKRFREFWANEYVGSMRAPDPALIFFFSTLDQALAEQREELREKIVEAKNKLQNESGELE